MVPDSVYGAPAHQKGGFGGRMLCMIILGKEYYPCLQTKVVIIRGMYCGLGALMGAPMVPDSGYGVPGHRQGGFGLENAWYDHFGKGLYYPRLCMLNKSGNFQG